MRWIAFVGGVVLTAIASVAAAQTTTTNYNNVSTSTATNNNNNVSTSTSTVNNNNVSDSTVLNNNINTSTSLSTATNTNINTSTSTATNTNINTSASTATNVNTSTSTAVNNNINANTSYSDSTARQVIDQNLNSPPPSAISPTIMSYSQDLCTSGMSGAAQTQFFGISFGKATRDENCERIKLSRTLYDMGMKVASVSLLCQDVRVYEAMDMAGTPCPYDGKIGLEAKAAWAKHPEKVPQR